MDSAYQWVPFYEALAEKLLAYSDKMNETLQLSEKVRYGYANWRDLAVSATRGIASVIDADTLHCGGRERR